ncbi:DUF2231 domain-containing protein [Nostoc punctiforme UO1]|uniref:DUF2231 domain-containing protein n=1 Tax=Nostoc punctiforme TaxID=272131 RepID=UPI0030A7DC67
MPLLLPLNNANLPYPDPLHPIIVHFAIAMVFFSFFCDVVGYFTRNHRLLEVSFWNMFVASVSIFLAVIFGQFEAGLAQPYEAVKQMCIRDRRQPPLFGRREEFLTRPKTDIAILNHLLALYASFLARTARILVSIERGD